MPRAVASFFSRNPEKEAAGVTPPLTVFHQAAVLALSRSFRPRKESRSRGLPRMSCPDFSESRWQLPPGIRFDSE
jgi:hypothetical protein